jgi:hypothetical protein
MQIAMSVRRGFLHIRDPAWHAEFAAADFGEYSDALAVPA